MFASECNIGDWIKFGGVYGRTIGQVTSKFNSLLIVDNCYLSRISSDCSTYIFEGDVSTVVFPDSQVTNVFNDEELYEIL